MALLFPILFQVGSSPSGQNASQILARGVESPGQLPRKDSLWHSLDQASLKPRALSTMWGRAAPSGMPWVPVTLVVLPPALWDSGCAKGPSGLVGPDSCF